MASRGTEDESEGVEAPREEGREEGLTILSKGKVIQYRVPSFPVYKAEIVEIKIQYEEEDGNVLVLCQHYSFDGYIKLWISIP